MNDVSASLILILLWSTALAFWGIVFMEEQADRYNDERFELGLAANSARLAKLYGKAEKNEDVCSHFAS